MKVFGASRFVCNICVCWWVCLWIGPVFLVNISTKWFCFCGVVVYCVTLRGHLCSRSDELCCWTRLRWSDQTEVLLSHHKVRSVSSSSSCVCLLPRGILSLKSGTFGQSPPSAPEVRLQRPVEQIGGQRGPGLTDLGRFRLLSSSLFGLVAPQAGFLWAAPCLLCNSFFSAWLSYRGSRRTLTVSHVPFNHWINVRRPLSLLHTSKELCTSSFYNNCKKKNNSCSSVSLRRLNMSLLSPAVLWQHYTLLQEQIQLKRLWNEMKCIYCSAENVIIHRERREGIAVLSLKWQNIKPLLITFEKQGKN